MFHRRSFLTHLILFFIISLSHAAQPPVPQLESVNMRHVLRWSPLQGDCLYSVQFKGEYEVLHNHTWREAPSCQKMKQTQCDLTHDLASNSEYLISVEAQCDGEMSWAQLQFNPKDSLIAPNMNVKVKGSRIEVFFKEHYHDSTIILKMWKEGDEQNVNTTVLTVHAQTVINVDQDGETYCLKAEVRLGKFNRSNSTETQCVPVPKPEPSWIKHMIVSITVAFTLTGALALGLITSRYGPSLQKIMSHKEPLPTSLHRAWPKGMLTFSTTDLLEPVHSVDLLQPLKEQDKGSEIHEGHEKYLLDS